MQLVKRVLIRDVDGRESLVNWPSMPESCMELPLIIPDPSILFPTTKCFQVYSPSISCISASSPPILSPSTVLCPATSHVSVPSLISVLHPATSHASVLHPATSHASVLHPATSHASVLHPATSHASVLCPATSHASVLCQTIRYPIPFSTTPAILPSITSFHYPLGLYSSVSCPPALPFPTFYQST